MAATMSTAGGSSIFRPTFALMSGQLVGFAASFAMPIALVRIFSLSEFGTYKLIFVIYATLFALGQIGMAQSLFYFVPASGRAGRGYVSNAVIVLAAAGTLLLVLLWTNAQNIATWLNNPGLVAYLPYLGVFLLMMLISAVLEITMIAHKHHRLAFGAYAASGAVRALLFVLPALILHSLTALMIGAIAFAALRLVATALYLRKHYAAESDRQESGAGGFGLATSRWKPHLAYALPFAVAVGIQAIQYRLGMYFVSNRFDAATFAIFAVGCLQIPLAEQLTNSTSSVLMVRMKELLKEGRTAEALSIWQDTTRKLTLILAGVVGALMVAAHALIVTLYTADYARSVPIFEIASIGLILTALMTNSIMRVYAQTRFLVVIKLVRIGVLAATIIFLMNLLGLIGAVCATLAAALGGELVALWWSKRLMHCSLKQLLPWKSLAGVLIIALIAATPALAARIYLELPLLAMLFVVPTVYGVVYLGLMWRFGPMHKHEKAAIIQLLRSARLFVFPSKRQLWYALDISAMQTMPFEALNDMEVLQCDAASVAAVPRSSRRGAAWRQRRLRREDAQLWIARKGEAAVASVWVFRGRTPVVAATGGWLSLPCGYVCLEDAVTAAQHRGQGIAPNLWRRLADKLAAEGVQTVLLKVSEKNQSALRAAEKAGFRPLALIEQERGWLRAHVRVSGRGGASAPGFLREQLAH